VLVVMLHDKVVTRPISELVVKVLVGTGCKIKCVLNLHMYLKYFMF